MRIINICFKNSYPKIIIIISLSFLIDNYFILKIKNLTSLDQGYHLSNVFKMLNILKNQ